MADPRQVAAAGGGPLGVLGARSSRRFAVRLFQGLTFCEICRTDPPSALNPFKLSKVLAGIGFFLGLTLLGSPIALLLFGVSFVSLRRRLRAFRQRPRASEIVRALDAAGTLFLAVVTHVLLLAVLGGAVVYLVYFKP